MKADHQPQRKDPNGDALRQAPKVHTAEKPRATELGLHLRRIQFALTVVTILAFAILYGHRDPKIQEAIDELQVLDGIRDSDLNHLIEADEIDPISETEEEHININDDTTLSDHRLKWRGLRNNLKIAQSNLTDKDGIIIQSDFFSSLLPTAISLNMDSDDLSDCLEYMNIGRGEFKFFTDTINSLEFDFNVCRWVGENTLLAAQMKILSDLEWQQVFLDFDYSREAVPGQLPDTFRNDILRTEGSRLDNCGLPLIPISE